jgi:hypothetical protein
VHDLWQSGFHSRAAAGGEDDGGKRQLAHRQLEVRSKVMSGGKVARRHRIYNTQFVAEYITTTQSFV